MSAAGPDPARYAIAGVEPLSVRRPATREEVAEVLRAAARDGLAVVPWGGGVALARGARRGATTWRSTSRRSTAWSSTGPRT